MGDCKLNKISAGKICLKKIVFPLSVYILLINNKLYNLIMVICSVWIKTIFTILIEIINRLINRFQNVKNTIRLILCLCSTPLIIMLCRVSHNLRWKEFFKSSWWEQSWFLTLCIPNFITEKNVHIKYLTCHC